MPVKFVENPVFLAPCLLLRRVYQSFPSGRQAAAVLALPAIVLLALFGAARPAQGQNVEGQIIASQYGTWKVPGYAPNTYSNFAPTACRVQGGASFFTAFSVGVPVRIVDGNPNLSETVIPTAVLSTNSTCSLTIQPVNHHQLPFYLTSATAGLQEAINANLANPQPNTIILNNDWYKLGGSTAIIASVHGSSTLGLVDVTKVPTVWYHWNGSQYVEVAPPSTTGGDTEVNDLFANNSTNDFEDLYHFYATSPTYTAQNAINAAAAQQGAVTIQPGAGHTPFSNPYGVKVVDNRTDIPATKRSIKEWGAQCDATSLTGSVSNSTLTLSSGSFSSGDVGMTVAIVGTDLGIPTAFEPTITAVSGSTATLSTPAPFTVSGAVFEMGHDDTAAIQSAIGYAGGHEVTLTIPSGSCLTHTLTINSSSSASWLRGFGRGSIGGHNSELVGFPGEDVIDGGNGANGDWGFFTIAVSGAIDPTEPWQIVDASGNVHSQTPDYRPLAAMTAYSNNPLGPGWLAGPGANGSGSVVGVGAVSNGSTNLTVASASVPTVGETILFPFASTGLFTTTVASVSGSTVILAAGFSGATNAQEEFFAGTSAQNIQTEITAGQTMPFTITLANSIAPTPVGESNVAPDGMVEIGDEEFKYVGYSKASPYTITLTARAQNGTAAADHAVNSIVVPLNPFEPQYPWPVTPTIDSGATTPANASYYPGFNVGNCGICTPVANGSTTAAAAFYQARVHDISIVSLPGPDVEPNAGIYLVQPPYASRFQNIDITFLTFGFVEGLPSVNNHPWIASGISANGNSYSGLSIHSGAAGMGVAIDLGGETSYRDFDVYTNGGPGFNLLHAYDDQTGIDGGQEAISNLINIYYEPGAPVYPAASGDPGSKAGPAMELDCIDCTWNSAHIEPSGESYIGGARQHFTGGNLGTDYGGQSQPVIVYSSNDIFDDVAGMWSAGALSNVYGQGSPIMWGPGNAAYGPRGSEGTTQQRIGYGCGKQPVLGQTNETFNTGNLTAPYTNSTDGLICPDEFNQSSQWENPPFGAWTFDATSPISQGYVPCVLGTAGSEYCHAFYFDTPAKIAIGPGQRLAAGKYIATISVKGTLPSNSFVFGVSDTGGATGEQDVTVPVTNTWSSYSFPVDFSSAASNATLFITARQATSADTVEFGYLDFAPVPQQLQLAANSQGATSTGCDVSPVHGIANSSWSCPTGGWSGSTAAAQGVGDTTLTLAQAPGAAASTIGCFNIDSETECYTGISGDQLTGLSRGQYATAAASHAADSAIYPIVGAIGAPNALPSLVAVGVASQGTSVVGINNPFPSVIGSASLAVNSGGNETDVDKDGSIAQSNLSATNYLAPMVVGGDVGGVTGAGPHQPITHSDRVLKADGENNATAAMSFSGGLTGPLNINSPATLAAPYVARFGTPGSTTYSYECTGVDANGNTIGGTAATVTNGPATLSGANFVAVSCGFHAGVASYTIWRMAGGPGQGYIATGLGQAGGVNDIGITATAGTPPGTTSAAEICIGAACWSSGPSAPSGSCSTGSLYTNTSGTPDTLYVCKAGAWAGVI